MNYSTSRPMHSDPARQPIVGAALAAIGSRLTSLAGTLVLCAGAALSCQSVVAATGDLLQPADIFELEFASDPQISPDGKEVVYVRNFMDIMRDRRRSSLWIIGSDGTNHRPLTTGNGAYVSPRWSPDGTRLLYLSRADGATQVFVRWMDTGQTARISNLTESAGNPAWSPDGEFISFTMRVPSEPDLLAKMPAKPEGAKWARPVRVVEKLIYRQDGEGYLEDGYDHLFVLPAEGGTPRQVTSGSFNHDNEVSWDPRGGGLVVSANRHDNWEYDPLNSEVYAVSLSDGSITPLTDRGGPDEEPRYSPDGKHIAYLGYDDEGQSYGVRRLYVMNRDGSGTRVLSSGLDREVEDPRWDERGRGLYFQYDDQGNTKIGYLSLDGKMETLAGDLGGISYGRPYAGGSFSVSRNGKIAFTQSRPAYPADVAAVSRREEPRRITRLNDDLLAHKDLAEVEEIWFPSSHDQRRIQGWIARPPRFDPKRKHPLILEIHGGPFANYGDRFSMEVQLYAAAGFVVLYVNPRGSTSYGEEFGNLIHHDYPGNDYDDLMSGIDAVLESGHVDEERLFVTGGSGGGVLTSWIIGKTDRFRAAVVAKPVINWTSFVLTADAYNFFYKYWFPGPPWEHPEAYLERSPLSLVGNVTTPTMILTGEADYRTPIAESEQYYQALKLRKIDAALVRVPGASHGISRRPSNLIAKVANILAWFKRYDETPK